MPIQNITYMGEKHKYNTPATEVKEKRAMNIVVLQCSVV